MRVPLKIAHKTSIANLTKMRLHEYRTHGIEYRTHERKHSSTFERPNFNKGLNKVFRLLHRPPCAMRSLHSNAYDPPILSHQFFFRMYLVPAIGVSFAIVDLPNTTITGWKRFKKGIKLNLNAPSWCRFIPVRFRIIYVQFAWSTFILVQFYMDINHFWTFSTIARTSVRSSFCQYSCEPQVPDELHDYYEILRRNLVMESGGIGAPTFINKPRPSISFRLRLLTFGRCLAFDRKSAVRHHGNRLRQTISLFCRIHRACGAVPMPGRWEPI